MGGWGGGGDDLCLIGWQGGVSLLVLGRENRRHLVVDEDILKKVQYISQRPRPELKVEGEGGGGNPNQLFKISVFVGSPGSYFVNKYNNDWP